MRQFNSPDKREGFLHGAGVNSHEQYCQDNDSNTHATPPFSLCARHDGGT